MACCAFAVFLLGQLVAAFAWLRRQLPRPLRRAGSAIVEVDPATSWQLFPAAPALVAAPGLRRRSRAARHALLVAVGLELAILGAGALGLAASRSRAAPGGTPRSTGASTSFWCRSLLAPVVAPPER